MLKINIFSEGGRGLKITIIIITETFRYCYYHNNNGTSPLKGGEVLPVMGSLLLFSITPRARNSPKGEK